MNEPTTAPKSTRHRKSVKVDPRRFVDRELFAKAMDEVKKVAATPNMAYVSREEALAQLKPQILTAAQNGHKLDELLTVLEANKIKVPKSFIKALRGQAARTGAGPSSNGHAAAPNPQLQTTRS